MHSANIIACAQKKDTTVNCLLIVLLIVMCVAGVSSVMVRILLYGYSVTETCVVVSVVKEYVGARIINSLSLCVIQVFF